MTSNMEKLERKLAAIMFTDIYQYSRIMSRNESVALRMLTEHDRIVESVILDLNGKILKRMGDAVFAEFNSSIDALNCAIKIQNDLKEYNSTKKDEERILIRVGLHQGDVIVKGNDLFGEGINVAARLEPLAEPGGICISQELYQAVQSHTSFNAIRVGDVELKNILKKYTIYKIPSPYTDEFSNREISKSSGEETYKYSIKKIINLPVKYFSPKEIAVFSLLFCVFWVFLLGYIIQGRVDLHSMSAFIKEEINYIFILTLCLILTTIYFYAYRSVRIVFDDIRDVDNVLEFLIMQLGYKVPNKEGGTLVFKPSHYNFIMYSARKFKANVDGNSVIITGNYMFMIKLIKLIRSCETV